jgi:DNA-binding response OmpR family regulator
MTFILTNEGIVNSDGILTRRTLANNSVLLVGSDQRLSDLIQHQLFTHGYHVTQKKRDESIANSISKNSPYLVLLDIGFSNIAMLSVITQIRAVFTGPLVLLTSRDSEQEQITAFNLGADEYLVKPVSENILNVRIDSLFKRYNKQVLVDEESQIQLGELTLFPHSYKCQLGSENISLTQFEFKLLRLLAENVGKIMSRDFIYTDLLGRDYNGSERTVDLML